MNKHAYELLQAHAFDVTGGWLHNVILPFIGFIGKWTIVSIIFWTVKEIFT